MSKKLQNNAPGMQDYRSRTEHGPLRAKRGDTHIETIEKKYGIDLEVRGDMHWATYKKLTGVESLNNLITGQ